MFILNLEECKYENFEERGAKNVERKKIVDDSHGSYRFYLRYYKVKPNGMTPYDIHNYEHIIIIIKGKGKILTIENNIPVIKDIKENDIIFIKANEPHQIINSYNEDLEFYCFRGTEILYKKEVSDLLNEYFKK